jgi:hypothetical protein
MFEPRPYRIACRDFMLAGCLTLLAGCGGEDGAAAADSVPPAVTPATPVAVPPAPTGLAASSGNAQANLTWSASSGATSYSVRRSTTNGGLYTQLASATTPAYTDAALSNGTTYYYVVAAVNSAGASANSAQVSASPLAPAGAPGAPTGLVATAGNAQASLTWAASSGATSYNVKRSTTSSGPYTPLATTSSASYIDTTVSNGTTYYYVVAAASSAGDSVDSAQVSVAPANTLPVVVTPPVLGDPGCGLAQAAFCDTFDAIAGTRGRAGDLDAARWSAARSNPQLPSANGAAFAAGPATLGTCRSNLPTEVFPPQDFSICDANDAIRSRHLAVGVGSQNYGQNSYRIRQPFDFAGRTGKIVFDAEGFFTSTLHGWASITISEDPTPVPSFLLADTNDEGGAIPRNAVEIHLQHGCGNGSVGVRFIGVFREQQLVSHDAGGSAHCVSGVEGHLNHFVIEISRTHVVVRATPSSPDGISFAPLELLYETDIDLSFERGYVELSTHNHATRKYTPGNGSDRYRDAWVTRWDNVGFDGPVRSGSREYEIGDSLVAGSDASNQTGPVVSVGYRVADLADAPRDVLTFRGVDLTGMARARIALVAWYLALVDWYSGPLENAALRYRLNGGAWRERPFTATELTLLRNGRTQGLFTQMLDVPIGDLVSGNNTLEFTTRGVPQQYPPLVAAIDLILEAP